MYIVISVLNVEDADRFLKEIPMSVDNRNAVNITIWIQMILVVAICLSVVDIGFRVINPQDKTLNCRYPMNTQVQVKENDNGVIPGSIGYVEYTESYLRTNYVHVSIQAVRGAWYSVPLEEHEVFVVNGKSETLGNE